MAIEKVLAAAAALLLGGQTALAEVNVVVTSKPVHAIVASVMQGAGTPSLLVDGTASPHTYAMKPSDAQKVNKADVFFRVSEALEPFTEKLVKSLPKSVRTVSLAEAAGVSRLPRRVGGTFERHVDAGKGHAGHSHAKKPTAEDTDPHVWLDPANAKAIALAVAHVLAEKSPADAAQFKANAEAFGSRADALAADLERELKPVAGTAFVVFHDALQYFERRFGLNAAGSITTSPDVQPSAKRLTDLRRKVQSLAAVCVFSEPQFQQKIVGSVIEGTRARTGMLDPEGSTLEAGAGLYERLLRKLGADMKTCLSPTS